MSQNRGPGKSFLGSYLQTENFIQLLALSKEKSSQEYFFRKIFEYLAGCLQGQPVREDRVLGGFIAANRLFKKSRISASVRVFPIFKNNIAQPTSPRVLFYIPSIRQNLNGRFGISNFYSCKIIRINSQPGSSLLTRIKLKGYAFLRASCASSWLS